VDILDEKGMPKWKKDAKEFVVKVNYEEKRGYQSYIPRPIMLKLGAPESLKYTVKGNKIEISAAKSKEGQAHKKASTESLQAKESAQSA